MVHPPSAAAPPAPTLPAGVVVLLYDGVCVMCNAAVRFVLRHDQHDRFRLASLQSDYGRALLRRHGRDLSRLDTFCLVIDPGTPSERLLDQSDAALHVARRLGGWRKLGALGGVVPKRLRDWIYAFVATRRYRWFGTYDECPLPTPDQRRKFIDV